MVEMLNGSIDHSTQVSSADKVAGWISRLGLHVPDYSGPWTEHRKMLVIPIGVGAEEDLSATVSTLLLSSVQDFIVDLSSTDYSRFSTLRAWVSRDDRFVWDGHLPALIEHSRVVLVLPVGLLLTEYSLAALFEVLQESKAVVVRVVIPGCPSTLEFWDAEFLASVGPINAERAAQKAGRERWIDGNAIGLHYVDQPAPKVFFRRGAADRHIIDISINSSPPVRAWAIQIFAIKVLKKIKFLARHAVSLRKRMVRCE